MASDLIPITIDGEPHRAHWVHLSLVDSERYLKADINLGGQLGQEVAFTVVGDHRYSGRALVHDTEARMNEPIATTLLLVGPVTRDAL